LFILFILICLAREMRFVFSTLCAPSKYIITFYPMVGTIRPDRKREIRIVVVARQVCDITKTVPVYLKIGGKKKLLRRRKQKT
jgi:hypothetical protein